MEFTSIGNVTEDWKCYDDVYDCFQLKYDNQLHASFDSLMQ